MRPGETTELAETVLHLSLSASVVATGRGIADSASQGALTATQLETRPVLRAVMRRAVVNGVVPVSSDARSFAQSR